MEFREGIEKIVSKFKRKGELSGKDTFLPQAREQVMLFANSPVQEPLSAYQAREGVVLDLTMLAPGTILRTQRGEKTKIYDWFVVGKAQKEHKTRVYQVTHRDDDEDLIVGTKPNLELRSTWGLQPKDCSGQFPVLSANMQLFKSLRTHVNEIDVMSGGLKQKQAEKSPVAPAASFKPVSAIS